MSVKNLAVDDRNRLFSDSADQLTFKNPAQIVSNSVGNAVEHLMQSLVAGSSFDGSRLDKIDQRAGFEFENFKQRKALEESVQFVKVVLDAGQPVEKAEHLGQDSL